MFRKVSDKLTGPIMLKSFNCNKRIALVAIETFQYDQSGEFRGNLPKHLKTALHFFR